MRCSKAYVRKSSQAVRYTERYGIDQVENSQAWLDHPPVFFAQRKTNSRAWSTHPSVANFFKHEKATHRAHCRQLKHLPRCTMKYSAPQKIATTNGFSDAVK